MLSRIVSTVSRAGGALRSWLAGWGRTPRQPTLPFPTPVAPAAPMAGGAADPREQAADLEAVAAACAKAGAFSRADIAKATGLGVDVVKRRLNVLLDLGWIEREKQGDYRWKGRLFWEGGRPEAAPAIREGPPPADLASP